MAIEFHDVLVMSGGAGVGGSIGAAIGWTFRTLSQHTKNEREYIAGLREELKALREALAAERRHCDEEIDKLHQQIHQSDQEHANRLAVVTKENADRLAMVAGDNAKQVAELNIKVLEAERENDMLRLQIEQLRSR